MAENTNSLKHSPSAIPPDNPERKLAIAQPNTGQRTSHLGVVGDTYTILLAAKDTAGRFCLIDVHIPPRGRTAPAPSRLRGNFQRA
jgi:hypothetical protein